jgi:hypothetical protein
MRKPLNKGISYCTLSEDKSNIKHVIIMALSFVIFLTKSDNKKHFPPE